MGHLIETGIDMVFTPQGNQWEKTWHNLQTAVAGGIATDGSNIPQVFCPVIECGLKPDFAGEFASVPADLQNDCDLSQFKLIIADCRNGLSGKVHPLHVPKKGYSIHQNRALFDCMVKAAQQVLGDDGFEIVTVGTLGGYSQFFMSIAIKGEDTFEVGTLANGAKDTWKKFFNLNSSHNGLVSSNRLLSLIRAVCFNTVVASINDATETGAISNIKHTANSSLLITPEQFAADLKAWIEQGKAFQSALEITKNQKMNIEQFRAFSAGVFTNEASDELSTNSFNRIGEMEILFQRGLGNDGATRYDAINAFTEFFTSGNGAGNPKNVSQNKRVATANFGRGNEWKLQAIHAATNSGEYNKAVARGRVLYSDKSQVVATMN